MSQHHNTEFKVKRKPTGSRNGDGPGEPLIAEYADRMRIGFTQLPYICRCGDSGASMAAVVYLYFVYRVRTETAKLKRPVKRIAKETGRSHRTITRAINLLVKLRLIEREQQQDRDWHRFRITEITLLVPPETRSPTLSNEPVANPDPQYPTRGSRSNGKIQLKKKSRAPTVSTGSRSSAANAQQSRRHSSRSEIPTREAPVANAVHRSRSPGLATGSDANRIDADEDGTQSPQLAVLAAGYDRKDLDRYFRRGM